MNLLRFIGIESSLLTFNSDYVKLQPLLQSTTLLQFIWVSLLLIKKYEFSGVPVVGST